MSPLEIIILGIAAFLTSTLSAIIGMAGGITLLAVLLLFLEPLTAIPIHGVTQLVSNGSRVAFQWENIRWGLIARFALLLLPMGAIGIHFAQGMNPVHLKILIGLCIILFTWLPKFAFMKWMHNREKLNRRFFFLGGLVGFVSVIIGATGPLIAPFFLNIGLSRQGIIGTKAACQSVGHFVKLLLFGAVGFAYWDHLPLLGLLCGATLLGSWFGTRILHRVTETAFTLIYRSLLTLIALKLVVWDGLIKS